MLKNYIRIALRNFFRQWSFSLLNIAGLAIGMATSILIFIWVIDEVSYDRFHDNLEELYRVYEKQEYADQDPLLVYNTPGPLAPALRENFPELKNVSRFTPIWRQMVFRRGDRLHHESNGYFADPSVFEMFYFEFISGDGTNALDGPDQIILTREMAGKYFGDNDPLGETITINNDYQFMVSAVVDRPSNTHFNFDFIVSFETNIERFWGLEVTWTSNSFFTYVQIVKGVDYRETEEKIRDFIKDHQEQTSLFLEPLSKSHLYNIWGTGAMQNVRIFSVVAFIVLLIACINFMNLSTARSSRRAREVGLRKVVGGNRYQIAFQFFGESVMYALIALAIALVLVELTISGFSNLAGKELSLNLLSLKTLAGLLLIALLTGIFSGSYPALFLSSFRPAAVLKGQYMAGSAGLRRALVVFQFALSVVLIISTLIINNQMDYVQNKNLGFQKENIVTLFTTAITEVNRGTLVQELASVPGVELVSASNSLPSQIGNSTYGISWEGKDPDQRVLFNFLQTDFGFIECFGIEIVDGRNFSREYASDSTAYIINEKAAHFIGGEEIIGKKFNMWGVDGVIIGVVKDFHFQNLKHQINPLVIRLSPSDSPLLHLRLHAGSVLPAMEDIKRKWSRICPDDPLNYRFFDQQFDRMYRAELRMSSILTWFSVLAIFISCLGLFGLASYMAEQKTREIGIRKVFGAGVLQIIGLMVIEFSRWVIIAIFAGIPVAWYFTERWLDNFAFNAGQDVFFYIAAALTALGIAILTVSWQALRAALSNPADSLRCE